MSLPNDEPKVPVEMEPEMADAMKELAKRIKREEARRLRDMQAALERETAARNARFGRRSR